MSENKDTTIKSSFDFKDLMNLGQNPAVQQQLQNILQGQHENHQSEPKNKDDAKKRLRDKINSMQNSRMGKSFQQEQQIQQMKNNSLMRTMGSMSDNMDVNALVEQVMKEQNLPNNTKQRKYVKRQVEELMEKMKK